MWQCLLSSCRQVLVQCERARTRFVHGMYGGESVCVVNVAMQSGMVGIGQCGHGDCDGRVSAGGVLER